MEHIFLGLGSNLGEREENIQAAVEMLPITIMEKSSLYETMPWGGAQGGWFLNQVVEATTELTPKQFLEKITKVETSLGRVRKGQGRYEARVIDIDILFWGDEILLPPEIHVPHPHIPERRFVLMPLSEIAPDFVHPVLKKSVKELLKDCPDRSIVQKLS